MPAKAAPGPPAGHDGSVALTDYAQLVWRKKALIVGGTLLCGMAALVFSLASTPVFEARATLIVQPPLIPGELKVAPLSLETYRVLLESDYMIDQTMVEMVSHGIIPPETSPETVKGMFWVEIYDAGRNTPLLDLWARADSGQRASKAANAWAEVFLRQSSRLAKQRYLGSAETVEAQYLAIQDSVADAEAALRSCQEEYETRLLQLETNWSRRITAFVKESATLLHDHDRETERLHLAFETRWTPELQRQRLSAKEVSLLDLEAALDEARAKMYIRKDAVITLEEALAAEPRTLVLERTASDQALLEQLANRRSGGVDTLTGLHLQSEVLNPAYEDLAFRLATARAERDELARELAHLPGEVERLRLESNDLRILAGEKNDELSSLLRERALTRSNLQADREVELTALEKKRELEVGQLQRKRDYEVEALAREAQAARAASTALAARNQSTRLARLEEESDARIGALAMAPHRPSRPRTILNVATALVVGLIMSILLAFLIEQIQPVLTTVSDWAGQPVFRSEGASPGSESSARYRDG